MMGWRTFISSVFFLTITMQSHAREIVQQAAAQCFQAAYPQTVKATGATVSVNGQTFVLAKSKYSDYFKKLNSAGLLDQLEQIYPLDFSTPKANEDAGRLRDDAFFAEMYGENEAEVRKNLVPIYWAPSGRTVMFNKVNGAAEKLETVGRELAADFNLKSYAAKTAGTFNYCFISGTKRRSAHAFGIAIDFSLPKGLGTYWQWSGCKEGKACTYPQALRQDAILKRMVAVFEKHGFIWGGKWYHYDSVHFEYRPELLIKQCRSL